MQYSTRNDEEATMSQFMDVFSKFTKGNKIISPAATIALVAFFMPWVLVSCEGQAMGSFSGWQLANGVSPQEAGTSMQMTVDSSPILFLVLFAAIGCLAVVFFVYRQQLEPRIGAFVSFGLAALSLIVILFKYAQQPSGAEEMNVQISLEPRLGLILTILAYVGVIVGASMDIMATGGWKLGELRETASRMAEQTRSSAGPASQNVSSQSPSAADERSHPPVDKEKH
jgi:hypothetical protein